MSLYEQGFSQIFEPTTTHHFDQSYGSIDAELTESSYDPETERDHVPQESDSDYEPYNWYTIEYWENTVLNQIVDWNGYIFRDLCYYYGASDYSIHTFDPLDLY